MKVYSNIINFESGAVWNVWTNEPIRIQDIKKGDRWNHFKDIKDGRTYSFQGRSLASVQSQAYTV